MILCLQCTCRHVIHFVAPRSCVIVGDHRWVTSLLQYGEEVANFLKASDPCSHCDYWVWGLRKVKVHAYCPDIPSRYSGLSTFNYRGAAGIEPRTLTSGVQRLNHSATRSTLESRQWPLVGALGKLLTHHWLCAHNKLWLSSEWEETLYIRIISRDTKEKHWVWHKKRVITLPMHPIFAYLTEITSWIRTLFSSIRIEFRPVLLRMPLWTRRWWPHWLQQPRMRRGVQWRRSIHRRDSLWESMLCKWIMHVLFQQ